MGSFLLLELLHLGTILDIDAEHPASTVSNKQFSLSLVEAHRSDLFMGEVSENALKSTSGCVPDLDALRVSSDKGEEDWVVQNRKASLVISQMIVCGLVIVIKPQLPATGNDSLRRGGDSERVDLIERAVECLNSGECSHVPDSEHARDIS